MGRLVGVLVIVLVLMWTPVFAGPWLAVDPYAPEENVETLQVEFDGTQEAAVPYVPTCTDKSVGCIWTDEQNKPHLIVRDLEGISDGQHTVRERSTSVWGPAEWSDPFVFSKSRPGKRSIRLVK